MTGRINTLTVVLERPIRDDDAQVIVQAIRAIRGVGDVKLGEVAGDCYGANWQRDAVWREALRDLAANGPESSEAPR